VKRRIERAADDRQVRIWWEYVRVDLEEGLVETLQSIVPTLVVKFGHL
jgi:hypothetical protein